MKKVVGILTLLGVVFLSGCQAIPAVSSNSPDYVKTMSFEPIPDKAVLYIYRTRLSDFQARMTSVDIGKVELTIYPNCVHRFELESGSYNFEPNGIGTFAIEEEIDIDMAKGSVNFVELHHKSRIAIPNVSKLIVRDQAEFERVMATDELCVVPVKVL